jgi:hypothetical protein
MSDRKKKPAKKTSKRKKKAVDRDALVVVRTHWFEPLKAPTVQVIKTPLIQGSRYGAGAKGPDQESRWVRLKLEVDLRTVCCVELKAIRRPLMDVEGTIKDAERLANEEEV